MSTSAGSTNNSTVNNQLRATSYSELLKNELKNVLGGQPPVPNANVADTAAAAPAQSKVASQGQGGKGVVV